MHKSRGPDKMHPRESLVQAKLSVQSMGIQSMDNQQAWARNWGGKSLQTSKYTLCKLLRLRYLMTGEKRKVVLALQKT